MKRWIAWPFLLAALQAAAQTQGVFAGKADCRIVNPAPLDDERATWSGGCSDGYASGKGILQWYRHGDAVGGYDGVMQRGRPDGSGTYYYANGTVFKGEFKEGRPHGSGVFTHADGSTTSGQYAEGELLDGHVDRVYPSGNHYTGDWRDDEPDGEGQMMYALGGSYQGGWKHGKQEGAGTITYPNGKQLAGTFHDGLRSGSATPAPKDKPRLDMTVANTDRASASRVEVARKLLVPAAAAYGALSFEQQLMVKEPYNILQDADEPPYPLRGQGAVLQIVSTAQQRVQLDQEILFHILIGRDGAATGVRVLKSPSPEFSRYFTAAALQVKFKPALCGGEPCAMAYPLRAMLVSEIEPVDR